MKKFNILALALIFSSSISLIGASVRHDGVDFSADVCLVCRRRACDHLGSDLPAIFVDRLLPESDSWINRGHVVIALRREVAKGGFKQGDMECVLLLHKKLRRTDGGQAYLKGVSRFVNTADKATVLMRSMSDDAGDAAIEKELPPLGGDRALEIERLVKDATSSSVKLALKASEAQIAIRAKYTGAHSDVGGAAYTGALSFVAKQAPVDLKGCATRAFHGSMPFSNFSDTADLVCNWSDHPENKIPYWNVILHGFALQEKGSVHRLLTSYISSASSDKL
jgi:hypothetical protein